MHVLGALLLIGATTGFGLIQALELRRKPRELHALFDALRLLKNDICSRAIPLPDALAHVAGKCSGQARQLFLSISDHLVDTEESFCTLWQREADRLAFLDSESQEQLRDLGVYLGKYEVQSQAEALDICIGTLQKKESTAEEAVRQYSRLYTGVGISVGAMLAVALY